jgi:hypothetical protein
VARIPNNLKKFDVVARATSSGGNPRKRAISAATYGT